jgi:hypothetical protein
MTPCAYHTHTICILRAYYTRTVHSGKCRPNWLANWGNLLTDWENLLTKWKILLANWGNLLTKWENLLTKWKMWTKSADQMGNLLTTFGPPIWCGGGTNLGTRCPKSRMLLHNTKPWLNVAGRKPCWNWERNPGSGTRPRKSCMSC